MQLSTVPYYAAMAVYAFLLLVSFTGSAWCVAQIWRRTRLTPQQWERRMAEIARRSSRVQLDVSMLRSGLARGPYEPAFQAWERWWYVIDRRSELRYAAARIFCKLTGWAANTGVRVVVDRFWTVHIYSPFVLLHIREWEQVMSAALDGARARIHNQPALLPVCSEDDCDEPTLPNAGVIR
jgi:hypothetical protein